MKSILLCGCGNIGYRHLQAMLAMPNPVAITIVEPNHDAHARIATLFNAAEEKGFCFDLRDAVPANRQHFDLVVIATSADVRRAAFDSIVEAHDVRVMILEKVLFQTIADLDAVGQILDAHGITTYVNCPRRYFPGYRELLEQVAPARPLNIAINGTGFGLASNGIHLIDLAEYLNQAALLSFEASGLQAGSIAAKRMGCVEVFGHVSGKLSNGAVLNITCDDRDDMTVHVTLEGGGFVAEIDEIASQIKIETAAPMHFSGKFVSQIWEIYHEALFTGQCGLTPYLDSARQHALFLAALSTHLGLDAASPCPIS